MANPATAELRDLVEDHLSRGKRQDIPLATICVGLAQIGEALQKVQERSESWGAVLGGLRTGGAYVRQALPALRNEAELRPLLAFADRQLAFADLLRDEIVRLQAGESTLV